MLSKNLPKVFLKEGISFFGVQCYLLVMVAVAILTAMA